MTRNDIMDIFIKTGLSKEVTGTDLKIVAEAIHTQYMKEIKLSLEVYEKWDNIKGSDFGKFTKQWNRNNEAWQAIKTIAKGVR